MAASDLKRRPSGRIEGDLDFFLVSLLSLFLEILLIRWIGTEIRIFAYFSNLVLVICFFGLGLGYAVSRLRLGLAHAAWGVAGFFLVTHPLAESWLGFRSISEAVASTDLNTWAAPIGEQWSRVFGFVRLGVLLVWIAGIFVPFGCVLGDYFDRAPARIRAYSINVAGSIAGIWLFAVLSFEAWPPVIWLAVAALLFLVPLRRAPRFAAAAALASLVALLAVGTAGSKDGETTWSAYQKLILREISADGTPAWSLEVNNTLYQYVLDLSDANLDAADRRLPQERRPFYYYNLPYRLHEAPRKVLIVGAGAGNDVAAALRNGAQHVDAVEIDRAIVDIGRRVHPEDPYGNPDVEVVVDDARAFFKGADETYDLIVFGLLDSHKLTSNFSNINLDSYVYTVESFREAHSLLRPGGAMVVAFQTFYPFIAWRLHDTLLEATGQEPHQFYVKPHGSLLEGTGGVVYFVGDEGILKRMRQDDRLLDAALRRYERAVPAPLLRQSGPGAPHLATDEWPYLYVASRSIPDLWLTIIGIVVVLALAGTRLAGFSLRRFDGQFFFLGAAFLFLETHTITTAQLFYGTTWVVSSIVISAILVMVLIGNGIVVRFAPERLGPWYVALLAAATLNWAIEPHHLLGFGSALAAVLAAAVAALPLLFAAVIFGSSFARTKDVRYAMSSNLLGALAGGLIECFSFVTGLQWIALFAVAFYALSWACLAWIRR